MLPHGQWAKTDLAPRRQALLADVPAPELAPVKNWPGITPLNHGNLRSAFAIENAQCELGHVFGDRNGGDDEATGAAIPDGGGYVDHDRPVGHFGDGPERLVWNVSHPRAIDIDGCVDDRRTIRQHGHALSDLGHRQAREVDQFEFGSEERDLFLEMAPDGLTLQRITHQCDSLQMWHQHLRRTHRVAEGQLIDRSGDVGRKVQSSRGLLVDRGKHHGHPGPQLLPRLHHELER